MTLVWFKLKLARAQWAIVLLAMLLQRSPAIKALTALERVLSQPLARIIQTTTWVATSMGLFHATAGATQFLRSPGGNPYSVNVGEDFQMTFTVTDAPKVPFRWEIKGTLAPGLILTGDAGQAMEGPIEGDPNGIRYRIEGNIILLRGQPTTLGIYPLLVQAFNDVGLTDNVEYEIQVNVVLATPEIVWNPRSLRIRTGGRAQFFFEAAGQIDSIQWMKDGLPLSGQSGSTLILTETSASDAGVYSVFLTNNGGTSVSEEAILTIGDPAEAVVVNLSNRGFVDSGTEIMTSELVIVGSSAKTILVRGLGPALASASEPGILDDPRLELSRTIYENGAELGTQVLLVNDDWEEGLNALELAAAMRALGKSLEPGSKDAAMLATLAEGVYTIKLSGSGEWNGVGLVELIVVE